MTNTLQYFNPFVDDLGYTHSIDKCSISFDIGFGSEKRLDYILDDFKQLVKDRGVVPTIKENCPPRSSLGWCKHFINFDSIAVFLGSFQYKKDGEWTNTYNCRMEFNPNKQLSDYGFHAGVAFNNTSLIRSIIGIFKKYCVNAIIKRLDYAVDVPFQIDKVICPMSRRKIQNYGTTKYFGVAGSHGRLKIYDKKLESQLDYTLTRIEYTFKYLNKVNFENIMILDEKDKLDDVDFKLTSNTEVLVKLCMALKSQGLDYSEYIKGLNSRKRSQVIRCVEGWGQSLDCGEDILNKLVFDLRDYLGLDNFDDTFVQVPEIPTPFDDFVDPSGNCLPID